MKVLITGGAGFIGSHLTRAWLARGAEVTVIDSLRTGKKKNLDGLDCQFVQGTIEDKDLVSQLAEGVDYIHHLAALVSVPESVEYPEIAESINIQGTRNVLDAAKKWGVKKVVLSSTCAVYGDTIRPAHSEDDCPAPASPYAITKLAAENYTNYYRQVMGVPTVVLRYFNVYGPGQSPKSAYASVIPAFIDKALKNEPLYIYGDGEQTRDFVFVGDIVAANLITAELGEGLYNVGNGVRTTVNDLANSIIGLSNSKSQINHLEERAGDVRDSQGIANRLRDLGWVPQTTMEQGMKVTYESFVN
jgi:nucleoside-diphosphate-sugar epimerase